MHPFARLMDSDQMADLFVREINEGMGDTLIKAGLIKCATGEGRISPKEEQVLRAAARAHQRTGCPILTHTTNGLGSEQLDIFESEGVSPEEVILSHIGCERNPIEGSERVLRRGANVSFDRIGMVKAFYQDEHWLDVVGNAIKKGYINQIMLSHDAAVFADAGIPAAMIFVRNQNGSHNPDEAMNMDDFELAVRVMAYGVADLN